MRSAPMAYAMVSSITSPLFHLAKLAGRHARIALKKLIKIGYLVKNPSTAISRKARDQKNINKIQNR